MDAHVLIDGHVGAKEEVLDVASAVTGSAMSVRDDTVEVKFGIRDSDSGGAHVLVGIEAIAADGDADAVDLGLARAHGTNDGGVGDFAACRDLVWADEEHGVVAGDMLVENRTLFGNALGATSPFVGQ